MKKALETLESQLIGLSLRLNPIDFDADKGLLNWDATETSLKNNSPSHGLTRRKCARQIPVVGKELFQFYSIQLTFWRFQRFFHQCIDIF